MALKTIYRAFVVQGIIHGGGGSQLNLWRRTYKQANSDLEVMTAVKLYDDSYYGVEAVQMDESKAWTILHEQGR